jgi:5S rRNA maturation endonuclease (ribonuclease M5)
MMDTNTMFRPLADEERKAAVLPQDDWTPITPVPADLPPLSTNVISRYAKHGFSFSTGWRYLDAKGQLLGCVVRYDKPANGHPASKDVCPFTFCRGPGGATEWRMKGWDAPRPLYGLDRLAARSQAPVLVVEGEKTADAAEKLFPDFVAVTSPGGSNAANKADWSPLASRTVIIWPDNDDSGNKYAAAVAEALGGASVVSVPSDFPNRWDLADTIPSGHDYNSLANMLAAAKFTEASGWPAPDGRYLRAELPEPPVLPLEDVFSPKWAEWMRAAAEAKSAPADYVVAAVLAVFGSLLGNTRWVSPWQGWAEPPILWSVIVGNPSANKSPGLDAVLVPLKQAEKRIRDKDQAALMEWRSEAEVAKLAESAWKEAVKAAIKSDEDPPARPASADAGQEPFLTRLAVSDTTIERLAVILSRQPRGTLLARDELAGWLMGMTRYSGGGSDRPFWLEAYGGRGYTVERMGREPVFVERLAVGVVGGIQPDRLRSLLTKADDDGLLARFLPIWPHPAPVKRPSLFYDELFVENAISRILMLDMPVDGDGAKRPWFIHFSNEARACLDVFRETVRELEAGSEGLLLSFIGKLPGMAARLSLVLAYLDWATDEADEPKEVTAHHFGRVAHLIESYLLPMARRAYADASVEKGERAARRLALLIREHGWRQFSSREVLRLNRPGIGTSDELNPALKTLEEADVIRSSTDPEKPGRGRPVRIFNVNPIVHRRKP